MNFALKCLFLHIFTHHTFILIAGVFTSKRLKASDFGEFFLFVRHRPGVFNN